VNFGRKRGAQAGKRPFARVKVEGERLALKNLAANRDGEVAGERGAVGVVVDEAAVAAHGEFAIAENRAVGREREAALHVVNHVAARRRFERKRAAWRLGSTLNFASVWHGWSRRGGGRRGRGGRWRRGWNRRAEG